MFEDEDGAKNTDGDTEKSSIVAKELESILVFPRYLFQDRSYFLPSQSDWEKLFVPETVLC